jgi:hypothetical protein
MHSPVAPTTAMARTRAHVGLSICLTILHRGRHNLVQVVNPVAEAALAQPHPVPQARSTAPNLVEAAAVKDGATSHTPDTLPTMMPEGTGMAIT